MKPVYYLAHPVSGDVEANLADTRAWLRAILENTRAAAVIAPWYGEVAAYGADMPPGGFERVMDDDTSVVGVCAGVIGTGATWSKGMIREREAANDTIDLVGVKLDRMHKGAWMALESVFICGCDECRTTLGEALEGCR